jgi:predicted Fe-Mo cluster-binding NifX family protein
MRILFPSTDDEATFDSPVERVLGNAKSFLVVDSQEETHKIVTNKHIESPDLQCNLSDFLIENNVDTVVCCEICSYCYETLDKGPVNLWICDGSVNIREAYNKLILGGLVERSKPDVCECIAHSSDRELIQSDA